MKVAHLKPWNRNTALCGYEFDPSRPMHSFRSDEHTRCEKCLELDVKLSQTERDATRPFAEQPRKSRMAPLSILIGVMLLSGCGPSNTQSCALTWTNERQVVGTKCNQNELVVGIIDSGTLLCAQVTALCPKSP